MGSLVEKNPALDEEEKAKDAFDPHTPKQASFTDVPGCIWQPMLETHCTIEPEIFLPVMHNLIRNPNIMSSHLFRADILYDSQKDKSIITEPGEPNFSDFTKHMKKDCQPVYAPVPGYQWQQTYVRQLVPRNRQLDKDLIQTCHFFVKRSRGTISNLILYIPHISDVSEMPWYHPKVNQVAFLHESTSPGASASGAMSVHFCQFSDYPLDQRLERTALNLLAKIHKHCRGNKAGYVKRGGHDQILPQQRFQDTYARLKAKYAKKIIDNWVEETDPSKHVFEDLGIAAFLIELWADMYDCGDLTTSVLEEAHAKPGALRKKFPGFVDIGCGNGLLINILNLEGYPGWGFDARKRKTWQTFDPEISSGIKEMVLVPDVLHVGDYESCSTQEADAGRVRDDDSFHNGIFLADDGTEPPFIVSNHADELTPWTPLIAYLNGTSFIAIPCCSHNLAGARFRAPAPKQAPKDAQRKDTVPHQGAHGNSLRVQQAAETGSLRKPQTSKKEPSAYASLCDYVSGLANEVSFSIEKELLRIPSTRNACLLGRFSSNVKASGNSIDRDIIPDIITEQEVGRGLSPDSLPMSNASPCSMQAKREFVRRIIARELSMPVDVVCKDWISRARQISGKKTDSH